jgi:hypothetical protein
MRLHSLEHFGSLTSPLCHLVRAMRKTKDSFLQLCLYADLVASVQGVRPKLGYVVMPWSDYVPQPFRMDDYSAFYRYVRRTFELSVDAQGAGEEYPEPKEHCEICRWQ